MKVFAGVGGKKRLILHIMTIAWMILIFLFSAQGGQGSSHLSSEIIKNVAQIFVRDFRSMDSAQQILFINNWQNIVRKNAHFMVYFVLGALVLCTLFTYKINIKMQLFFAFGIVVLYAVSDEIHQMFVPGRVAMISDVLIDATGGAVGMILMIGARWVFRRRRRLKSARKS